MFHVELHSGSAISGDAATATDLTEDEVRERFIAKRETGEDLWVQGKRFRWNDTTFRVFEGPATRDIPNFSKVLGLMPFEISGELTERTDDFVSAAPGGAALNPAEERAGTAVFLVHGSDGRREEVARFLERMLPEENKMVILHEQPNRGQTLIEKFETNAADARFAVVLLTGDDEGNRKYETERETRARQNVVFELGFFFGKLGRDRVVVLYEPGVALPSDVGGLAYVGLGDAQWKLELAKELRDAGLQIDLNLL